MDAWLSQLAYNTPYIVVIGVILLSGLGLPLPEDIPLLLAGYLAGQGYVSGWIMFPACVLAILGADLTLYVLGRRYGHHVPKLPLIRRYLTAQRLAKAEYELLRYGGKFIFVARFMPGLRAPAMFAAGVFKVPAWKFLSYDGAAALLSVPLILGIGYIFCNQIERAKEWVKNGQLTAAALVVLVVAGVIVMRYWYRRKHPAKL